MAPSQRNELIAANLSLVQAIAAKLKRSLGRTLDFEDLVAYGSKGLVEAADRFDPALGVSFSTFAYYRIRGAMLDGMRTMGWYSRADYARYRAEERANELLRAEAERESARDPSQPAPPANPTQEQTLAEVAALLGGVAAVHITSLEAAASVVDERLAPPDADLERLREGARVRRAIATLPEKERRLMELYYFGDKNLEEAGAELGLSKSWACRLHARAVKLLRDALDED
jgi:RNA polymerase sigma factor for flagellar operon FliA